jgi:hypothetical protein
MQTICCKLPLSLLAVFLATVITTSPVVSAEDESAADVQLVSGWAFSSGGERKISATDGKAGDNFGTSVSICGSYAYAGAPLDKVDNVVSGSVYEYLLKADGSWAFTDKIVPGTAAADDRFGFSVSCEGNVTAVGAPNDGSEYTDGGAVHVYVRRLGHMTLSAKITSYYAEESENFGYSVAMAGDLLLVGAIGSSHAGDNCGIVYAYRKERERTDDLLDDDDALDDDAVPVGWSIEAVFFPADAAAYDNFGFHIAVSGGLIVVGSPNADARRGAAYVYNRTLLYDESDDDLFDDDGKKQPTYLLLRRLTAGEGTVRREFFGISVAVHAHTIVVGQYKGYDDSYVVPHGAAHVFTTHTSGRQLQSWAHVAILTEPVPAPVQNFFGRSVAVRDNSILVDAPGSSVFSNATVYAFGRYHAHDVISSAASSSIPYVTATSDQYAFWSHQATLAVSGRAQQGLDIGQLGQALAMGSRGIGIVGSPTTTGSRAEASGAIFAFRGEAIDGSGAETDDDALGSGAADGMSGMGVNKDLVWLVLLIIPACILGVCLYTQQRKKKRRRAGPSTSGRAFGEGAGAGGGYADSYDNATEISDLDSDMSFRDIRGRVKNKLSMLSSHAKDWVDGAIQNPVRDRCIVFHCMPCVSNCLNIYSP